MHITPIVILDGEDVSDYFISCHMEQTANSAKDPGKYDLTLCNPGGRFTGSFAPKNLDTLEKEELALLNAEGPVDFRMAPKKRVGLRVRVHAEGCEGSAERTITIFSGEIQKAEADELFLRVEGSCTEGGMTSKINPKVWDSGTTITQIVSDLLDDFGFTGPRHIHPAKNEVDDVNPELGKALDFDTALYEVSCWAQSIYFFDENDEFWFVPATDFRGFSDLTGYVLRGSNASNMVGYCNITTVYGGSVEDINERKTHNLIFAEARAPDWEIQSYGELRAPPVVIPNADRARCQKVADNLLEQYRQFKDVPSVRVSGVAPGLLSKVQYRPWNGSLPPVRCDGVEEAEMGPILGLVTRRVVDLSAESGFVATLDITTNFYGVNKPDGDGEIMNFYALNRASIDADPGILTQYPGVTFV